jgi:hypothetical protein
LLLTALIQASSSKVLFFLLTAAAFFAFSDHAINFSLHHQEETLNDTSSLVPLLVVQVSTLVPLPVIQVTPKLILDEIRSNFFRLFYISGRDKLEDKFSLKAYLTAQASTTKALQCQTSSLLTTDLQNNDTSSDPT